MGIVRNQIAHNFSNRTEPIQYIVVHDTGNYSAGSNASAHFRYYNSENRDSSADIFVDDQSIWIINDYNKYYTWHCGDGNGKYGITNRNSVGVEMCVNIDGDYTSAMKNTADAVRMLMDELGIPLTHVVRHYDASRKNCPASMSNNNWERWRLFLAMLEESEDLPMDKYTELKDMITMLDAKIDVLTNPMIYNYIDDNMPEWARDSVRWAVDKGIIKGDGKGLALNDDKLWMIVVMKRIADGIVK